MLTAEFSLYLTKPRDFNFRRKITVTEVLKSKDVDENQKQPTSRRSFIKLSSAAVLTAFAFGALKPESLMANDAF